MTLIDDDIGDIISLPESTLSGGGGAKGANAGRFELVAGGLMLFCGLRLASCRLTAGTCAGRLLVDGLAAALELGRLRAGCRRLAGIIISVTGVPKSDASSSAEAASSSSEAAAGCPTGRR